MTAVLLSRNTAFADFKLRGHRGSGGFSDVYEAIGKDNKRVAIKVLRVPGGASAANMERFERELRILQRMDNRRIARLVAAKLDSDTPWIASEYIDGPNLREALNERGNFEISEAVQVFSVVINALAEIHAQGIAHRDITPNNILLGEYGPVIIDFGSAKENLTGELGSVLSVGTPEFAAPEVLDGVSAGLASDVYSLAKVLLFLIGSDLAKFEEREFVGITPQQYAGIVKCLSKEPRERPSANELTTVFPIADIIPQLKSDGYRKINVEKLPLRISIKALMATVIVTGVIVGVATMIYTNTEPQPLTVKMIESQASELKSTLFLEKTELQAGWLLAGPSFDGAPLEYENPNNLDQGPSLLGLEGYRSNVDFRDSYLEVNVELLRYSLLRSLDRLDLSMPGDYLIKDYEVYADKFKNFLNKFQSGYTVGTCSVLKAEKFAVQPSETAPRIRLLGMFDNCRWESSEVSGYAVMDVYPEQDVIVYTTVNSRVGVVDLQSLLNGFEVNGKSIIQEPTENYTEMFAHRSEYSNALDTSDTGNNGGHQLYARRAFRVPPGSSAEISRQLSEGPIDFNDQGHSPVSLYFYHELELDQDETPQIEDYLFPYGQLVGLSLSESRFFSNHFESDMILVAEVTQTNRLPTSFGLRVNKSVVRVKQFYFNEDFSGSGSSVEDEVMKPRTFMFGLPTSQSNADQLRGDQRQIDGIRYQIPNGWTIVSDELKPSPSELVVHANPFGWPLDSVRLDMPRLEIYDSDLNELIHRKGYFLWWLADYEGCSKPPIEFVKQINRIKISWKVLDDCRIPVEYNFGYQEQAKARQANPIIKFMVVAKVGPTDSEYELAVAMGEYVPELDTSISFWEEMVETLAGQSEGIYQLAKKKCYNIFKDPSCLTK